MADGFERELRLLDVERPLSSALRDRLESALLEEAAAGNVEELLAGLDAPRPLPPSTLAAIERELVTPKGVPNRGRVLLAMAAAVLLLVGTFAALRAGPSSPGDRDVAAGPRPSVPNAGVPPILRQVPTTTEAPATTRVTKPPAPPTTRRSTTTTTWDCGLCAKNGALRTGRQGGSAAAAGSAGGAAGSPNTAPGPDGSTGAVAASAALSGPYISGIDPSSGPGRGGTIVTLTGFGFTGASGVRFGNLPAANFTVVSDTEVRVMAPRSPTRQTVDVFVDFPDGSSTFTSPDGPKFTYT